MNSFLCKWICQKELSSLNVFYMIIFFDKISLKFCVDIKVYGIYAMKFGIEEVNFSY